MDFKCMKQFQAVLGVFVTMSLAGCGSDSETDSIPGPTGVSSGVGSTHNSGQDCVECHKDLEYGATIYTDGVGTALSPGETIIAEQLDGVKITMVSDESGNFWSTEGDSSVGYWITVKNSADNMPFRQTYGGCNNNMCHDGEAVKRIHRD